MWITFFILEQNILEFENLLFLPCSKKALKTQHKIKYPFLFLKLCLGYDRTLSKHDWTHFLKKTQNFCFHKWGTYILYNFYINFSQKYRKIVYYATSTRGLFYTSMKKVTRVQNYRFVSCILNFFYDNSSQCHYNLSFYILSDLLAIWNYSSYQKCWQKQTDGDSLYHRWMSHSQRDLNFYDLQQGLKTKCFILHLLPSSLPSDMQNEILLVI